MPRPRCILNFSLTKSPKPKTICVLINPYLRVDVEPDIYDVDSRASCDTEHMGVEVHEDAEYEDVRSDKIICKLCYQDFATLNHLKTHEKHAHKEDQVELAIESLKEEDLIFPCDYCQLRFLSQNILNNHVKSKHTAQEVAGGGNGFDRYCELCDVEFKLSPNLVKHKKTFHVN